MKKLSAIFLALFIVSAMCMPVFATEAITASIDTSASTAYYLPGDTVNVVLSLSDISFGTADGVSALEFELTYNSYMVTPQIKAETDAEGDKGDFTALISQSPDGWEGFGVLNEAEGTYSLAFSDYSGTGAVSSDGELVIVIPFTVNENVNVGKLIFSFDNVVAYSANMEKSHEIYLQNVMVNYSPQPDEVVTLPSDAVSLDIAGYKHDVNNVVYFTAKTITVRDYVSEYVPVSAGQDKLLNYGIIIVGVNGVITYCDTSVDSDKSEIEIPANSYIIAVHKDSADYASFAANADVNKKIELYNINVKATNNSEAFALSDAGFVIGDYVNTEFELVLKEGVEGQFSADGKYFVFLQPELSVDEFKNLFVDPNFDVLDKNGNVCESGLVGTGKTIAVGEGITIVLLGDINADGKHKAVDYLMLKRVVFGELQPDDASYQACRLTNKDSVKAVDYLVLKQIIIGTKDSSDVYNQFWA